MPFLLLGIVLLLPLLFAVLLPVSIVQRYRVGTARRLGRSWIAKLNFILISLSAFLFIWASAMMSFWLPRAFPYAVAGFITGCLLGLVGLKLTRWESTARGLHYTPNRALVLIITIAVAARILYGFWRGWQAWHDVGGSGSWLADSGAAGSLGVGGVVLGYYVSYWSGVARRLKKRGRLKYHTSSPASQ
ncbi:hypothetical protein BH18VER1_BH18VER1_16890 [soil metagenome]